jgi:hypothetical protein
LVRRIGYQINGFLVSIQFQAWNISSVRRRKIQSSHEKICFGKSLPPIQFPLGVQFLRNARVVVSPLQLATGPTAALEPAPAPGMSLDWILSNSSEKVLHKTNDPTIFSDEEEKLFGSANLPCTEDMDMLMATTINRYRDEPLHYNKLPDPTHGMLGALVVLSN